VIKSIEYIGKSGKGQFQMNFRYFRFALPFVVFLFLTLLVSCAENRSIPKMSPSDDKSCRLALIKVRVELQSLKDAVSRYEKLQEKARKVFKTRNTDMTTHQTRLRDGAKDVQMRADRVKQEINGLCPVQTMSKQSQKEYKLLAADTRRISDVMDKIDCTFCNNTDQCRHMVSPPACDSQACQEYCGTNCPSGIDNCSSDCIFAAAKCVIQQSAEKAAEAVVKVQQN
jgi:hypothetical protein